MDNREMENYGEYLRGLRDRKCEVEARERNARGQLALLYEKRLRVFKVTGLEDGQINILIREQERELRDILNERYQIDDELDEAYIRENAEEISKQIAKDVANAAANLAAGGAFSGIDITGTENEDE